jgi:hypothetical protein
MISNSFPRHYSSLCLTFASALFVAIDATSTVAMAATKKNPTSKIFVADVDGQAEIDTGEKIEDLDKKSVHTAEGATFETKKVTDEAQKEKNTSSMVYSNGTGIFFDSDTKLEVKKFVQEPFSPNRTDMDVEPSISQTQAFLSRGSIGLCSSKLVAGSSMIYQTPQGSINVRGRKVVIETSDKYTKVSMLEGESTVRGGTGSNVDQGGQPLHAGQQAIIEQGAPGEPPTVRIGSIPPSEMSGLDDKASMACMAKKTVYFEVTEKKTGGSSDTKASSEAGTASAGPVTAFDNDGQPTTVQEIVPVDVVPVNLPVQYTISPARLGP